MKSEPRATLVFLTIAVPSASVDLVGRFLADLDGDGVAYTAHFDSHPPAAMVRLLPERIREALDSGATT